jgi:hypothetical protein
LSAGEVFDLRQGKRLRTFATFFDALDYAGRLNRTGHRVRQDRQPSPANPPRFVANRLKEGEHRGR